MAVRINHRKRWPQMKIEPWPSDQCSDVNALNHWATQTHTKKPPHSTSEAKPLFFLFPSFDSHGLRERLWFSFSMLVRVCSRLPAFSNACCVFYKRWCNARTLLPFWSVEVEIFRFPPTCMPTLPPPNTTNEQSCISKTWHVLVYCSLSTPACTYVLQAWRVHSYFGAHGHSFHVACGQGVDNRTHGRRRKTNFHFWSCASPCGACGFKTGQQTLVSLDLHAPCSIKRPVSESAGLAKSLLQFCCKRRNSVANRNSKLQQRPAASQDWGCCSCRWSGNGRCYIVSNRWSHAHSMNLEGDSLANLIRLLIFHFRTECRRFRNKWVSDHLGDLREAPTSKWLSKRATWRAQAPMQTSTFASTTKRVLLRETRSSTADGETTSKKERRTFSFWPMIWKNWVGLRGLKSGGTTLASGVAGTVSGWGSLTFEATSRIRSFPCIAGFKSVLSALWSLTAHCHRTTSERHSAQLSWRWNAKRTSCSHKHLFFTAGKKGDLKIIVTSSLTICGNNDTLMR